VHSHQFLTAGIDPVGRCLADDRKDRARWFAGELNRHKGQLLLRRGHPEAADELYRKALSIAAEQEAKFRALRAATSLARLRRDQGRPADARDLLAP
jgi:predicted ATPase